MKTVNVGLIGIGKMGILHGGILHSMDNVVPIALADSQTQLHKFAKSVLPNVKLYKDYREMLDTENLDLVYITTPTAFHPVIAEECIDRGISFFVEKPLGLYTDQCTSLVRKLQEKPVVNMVGYIYHFHDVFRKGKMIIDSGVLGDLVHLKSYMYITQTLSKNTGATYKKSVIGGGVLNVVATHLVDILLWFFGDIEYVEGNTRSYYSQEVEDYAHSYLKFKNGLEGYLDTSWSLRDYRLPEIKIEVEAQKGKLVITEDNVKLYLDETARWETWNKQTLYEGVEIDVGGPEFTREDRYMVESVIQGKSTDIDVLHAYEVQRVTDAIYISAGRGKRVAIASVGALND